MHVVFKGEASRRVTAQVCGLRTADAHASGARSS